MDSVSTSSWESFKNFISRPIKGNYAGLGEYSEYAWFFLVGFVAGFLFKYLGRIVFFSILILAGSLWLLSYFNLVTINMPLINDILGLNSISIKDTLFSVLYWVKAHIIESLCLLAGFFSAKILT